MIGNKTHAQTNTTDSYIQNLGSRKTNYYGRQGWNTFQSSDLSYRVSYTEQSFLNLVTTG